MQLGPEPLAYGGTSAAWSPSPGPLTFGVLCAVLTPLPFQSRSLLPQQPLSSRVPRNGEVPGHRSSKGSDAKGKATPLMTSLSSVYHKGLENAPTRTHPHPQPPRPAAEPFSSPEIWKHELGHFSCEGHQQAQMLLSPMRNLHHLETSIHTCPVQPFTPGMLVWK